MCGACVRADTGNANKRPVKFKKKKKKKKQKTNLGSRMNGYATLHTKKKTVTRHEDEMK